MKLAVCALILKDGLVLAVSRKDNPNDFGLPGGKVDMGETLEEALIREVDEEIGKKPKVVKPVFKDMDGEYEVFTFKCYVDDENFSTTEAGVIAWKTWDELCSGSFGAYNKALKEKLGL